MKKTDRLVPFQFRILCYAFYRKCRKNNFYGSHFLMSEKYILYNPYAGGPEAKKAVKALQESNPGAAIINICRITSYTTLFNGLEPDASVILCGGDGTLNRFINDVDGIKIQNKLYYYPTGTGNDFARDVNQKPFLILPCASIRSQSTTQRLRSPGCCFTLSRKTRQSL